MEKLYSFDSFLNEKKIIFGTADAFDKLTDDQQHFVLLILGMIQYNKHLRSKVELSKDGSAVLLIDALKPEDADKLIKRAIELVKGNEKISSAIVYTPGTGKVEIKK